MSPWVVILLLAAFGALASARRTRRRRILDRLATSSYSSSGRGGATRSEAGATRSALRRWLSRAGLRRRDAPTLFVAAIAVAGASAFGVLAAWQQARIVERVREVTRDGPAALVTYLVPLVEAAPYLLGAGLLSIPFVEVRRRRRARVLAIEEDLPAVLELLAAMARAGLGFDGALARVLRSEAEDRALASELRLLQRDAVAGVPRAAALRRLSDRVDLPGVSTFCSAIIHAETAGIGLAEILRQQADDMRNRRRESALLAAQSLPVKLVFPLVLCFLPALFVFTLGPAFASFFQLADQIIGSSR